MKDQRNMLFPKIEKEQRDRIWVEKYYRRMKNKTSSPPKVIQENKEKGDHPWKQKSGPTE